jgi:hypothetical protein
MLRLYVAWPISGYFELRRPIGRKDWTECRPTKLVKESERKYIYRDQSFGFYDVFVLHMMLVRKYCTSYI